MNVSNKSAYEDSYVVSIYTSKSGLQKPEQRILQMLKSELQNMRMLDIGVGAGRTTYHFANLAMEYVGMDYSENMTRACRERFPNAPENISFVTCDARNLEIFDSDYFDFVLFSFNGIDSLDHAGRIEALGEIKRVCKKGGIFFFSSHNLNSVTRLFSIRDNIRDFFSSEVQNFPKSPRQLLKRVVFPVIARLLNPSPEKLKEMRYVIIRDGAHRFRIKNYYIMPEEQIKQLNEVGFDVVGVYCLNGEDVNDRSSLEHITDYWIYYMCKK